MIPQFTYNIHVFHTSYLDGRFHNYSYSFIVLEAYIWTPDFN